MKTPIEEMLNYKILALIVLAIFYGIYFAKNLLQIQDIIKNTNR